MVNILAWRSGSVGSSPSQKERVIMDDIEKQLKWAIKIDEVASSKENWDEDQEAFWLRLSIHARDWKSVTDL